MSIDAKVAKTLAELGVSDAQGVESLFAEVRAAMEAERENLRRRGAVDEAEKTKFAKEVRDQWLARKNGFISLIDENWLKKSPKDLKPTVGRFFNHLRNDSACMEINELVKLVHVVSSLGFMVPGANLGPQPKLNPSAQMTSAALGAHQHAAAGNEFVPTDLTLPGYRRPQGSIHPITQVSHEIEDIFLGLGFRIETGPEVESVYYNFDALNIPESHPSRDDFDTIYVDAKTLLRTHTSPVQIRAMEKHGAPLYVIAPGKVYRNDSPDASHSPMFHQIEGLAVDKDITFADLKGTLDFFARKFFGEKIRTRFSPSFFPFTEPSGQVDISCVICDGQARLPDGQGCRTCHESGWVEVMGCGMVHPEVLRHGGIDPEQFTGWAFGLGVERFAMMKFGINDIQLFYQGDVRFLEQF